MAKIIGIDLGTTNSEAAYMEGGAPKIIPSAEGSAYGGKMFPSVVAFTKDGILVGEPAKRQAVLNPDKTVMQIKRKMGTDYKVRVEGKDYMPQEISAMVLRRLTLVVVEVGGDRDDDLADFLAEECLGVRLDLPQDHRGDLLGHVVFAFDSDLVVRAHLPLDLHDGLVRVQHRLALRRLSHQDPVLREGDDRREHLPAVRAAFRARDDLGRSTFHARGLGVGGPEVDSDDLSH